MDIIGFEIERLFLHLNETVLDWRLRIYFVCIDWHTTTALYMIAVEHKCFFDVVVVVFGIFSEYLRNIWSRERERFHWKSYHQNAFDDKPICFWMQSTTLLQFVMHSHFRHLSSQHFSFFDRLGNIVATQHNTNTYSIEYITICKCSLELSEMLMIFEFPFANH